jgi:hypothetical protein
LFTSDEKRLARAALDDALLAAFFALFGGVYELFSHAVYSYWMIYAFAVPLVGGVIPTVILLLRQKLPPVRSLMLWHFGLVTLTVGAVMQGVVAIYGSTNRLITVYPVAGGLLLLAGAVTFLRAKRSNAQ